MLKKILKGLTISLGAGLLMRACAKRKAGATANPLVARLAAMETRMCSIERVAPGDTPAGEIAVMREMVTDMERRNAEQIANIGQRLDELQNHLPRFIDVKVSTRVREMEERIKADVLETRGKTFETFIASLETKMLTGIAVVERSLAAQSNEIGELKQRLGHTDQNLSKVLMTVERLTDSGAFQLARFSSFAEPAVNGH